MRSSCRPPYSKPPTKPLLWVKVGVACTDSTDAIYPQPFDLLRHTC